MAKENGFVERIKNTFPFEKNGLTYNLISIDEYNQKKRTYYVSVIDNEGYKYKHYFNTITDVNNRPSHKRFFYNNPYTLDNIKNFMKINNICDLELPEDISLYSAIKKMPINIKGRIFDITWNDIFNNPSTFNVYNIDIYTDYVIAKKISKDETSKIILDMYEEKGYALNQDDFDGRTTSTHIGIRLVEKYFGTMENMSKELGIPLNDNKILSDKKLLDEIKEICNKIFIKENRKIILSKDLIKYGTYNSINRYNDRCRQLNTSLREVIASYGFNYQSPGNGMNYIFEDGEHVLSKYEYDFSKFLRENGFIYNKTYFRDIEYSEIDKTYNGKMNCDYKIIINNKIVYVELAGILGNKNHQEAFLNNTEISNSKSKEQYRIKLNKKKEIFDRTNQLYYILLPNDINEENFNNIINQKEVT